MKTLIRFRLPLIFIVFSVFCALVVFGIMRLDLFQIVKDVPVEQLRAHKPISLSNRVYFTGECKIQLYGWMNKNPGPTDGADQYLKIHKLNAVLDSVPMVLKEDSNDAKSVNEHIWTINTPRTGVLTVTVDDYETLGDSIKYADVFLDCDNSVTKTTFLAFLAVSILSGLFGLILLCFSIVTKGIRTLKH